MTPEEKAIELIGKMCGKNCTEKNINKKRKFALIMVDEIIDANMNAFYTIDYVNTSHAQKLDAKVRSEIGMFVAYWEQVKNQIKLL